MGGGAIIGAGRALSLTRGGGMGAPPPIPPPLPPPPPPLLTGGGGAPGDDDDDDDDDDDTGAGGRFICGGGAGRGADGRDGGARGPLLVLALVVVVFMTAELPARDRCTTSGTFSSGSVGSTYFTASRFWHCPTSSNL